MDWNSVVVEGAGVVGFSLAKISSKVISSIGVGDSSIEVAIIDVAISNSGLRATIVKYIWRF